MNESEVRASRSAKRWTEMGVRLITETGSQQLCTLTTPRTPTPQRQQEDVSRKEPLHSLDCVGDAIVAVVPMNQQQRSEVPEFSHSVVRVVCGLTPFLSHDPHPNVRFLDPKKQRNDTVPREHAGRRLTKRGSDVLLLQTQSRMNGKGPHPRHIAHTTQAG